MRKPLMPKATASWLIDNTTLSFEQIGEFVGLHVLEIQAIADGEVSSGILPRNPLENGELSGPHIVVIGASHAGVAFVDKVRKNGFGGRLTVFDRQVGGPMERPPLSKAFLLGGGETVESKSLLRQKKWYKTNKIKLKTQSNVEAIDTKKKTITAY